jgi:DNA-directed RNA polymerase subunit M/transcription elongation factor TFIIS
MEEEDTSHFEEEEDNSCLYTMSKEWKPILKDKLPLICNELKRHELRVRVTEWLEKIITSKSRSSVKPKNQLHVDIEKCFYSNSKTPQQYMDKVRRFWLLTENVDKSLPLKEIVKQVTFTNPSYYEEFASQFECYEEEERLEIKKIQTPLEVVEGLFTCPQCGKDKTYHYSMQIRRADEPPTVFINCTNKFCKHKWRMG